MKKVSALLNFYISSKSLETINFNKKAKKSLKTKIYMSGNTVFCLQIQLGPIIHRAQLCVELIERSSIVKSVEFKVIANSSVANC